MITGNVSGPCMSGFYYVTALPRTNLFLMVIENWKQYKNSFFYNFNCKIAQRYVAGRDCGDDDDKNISWTDDNGDDNDIVSYTDVDGLMCDDNDDDKWQIVKGEYDWLQW